MFKQLQRGVEIRQIGDTYQLFLNGSRLFLMTGHNRFDSTDSALATADKNMLTRPTVSI